MQVHIRLKEGIHWDCQTKLESTQPTPPREFRRRWLSETNDAAALSPHHKYCGVIPVPISKDVRVSTLSVWLQWSY